MRLSDGKCWEKDGSWLNLWANLSTEIIIFFLTLFELIWLCSTSICKNQGNPTKSRMRTLPAVLSIYVHSQPVVPIRRIEGATDRRVQRIALSQIRYSGNRAIEPSTFKHLFLTGRKVQIKSVTY